MCKPWKINGAGGSNRMEGQWKPSEQRLVIGTKYALEEGEEYISLPEHIRQHWPFYTPSKNDGEE